MFSDYRLSFEYTLFCTCPIGGEVNLSDVLSLDRDLLTLVLAAVAHTAGTHEATRPDGRDAFNRVDTLHPWPHLPRKCRLLAGGA